MSTISITVGIPIKHSLGSSDFRLFVAGKTVSTIKPGKLRGPIRDAVFPFSKQNNNQNPDISVVWEMSSEISEFAS